LLFPDELGSKVCSLHEQAKSDGLQPTLTQNLSSISKSVLCSLQGLEHQLKTDTPLTKPSDFQISPEFTSGRVVGEFSKRLFHHAQK